MSWWWCNLNRVGRECFMEEVAFGERSKESSHIGLWERMFLAEGTVGRDKSSEARACLLWSKRNMESLLFGVEGGRGWVIDKIRELVRGWDRTGSWGMLLRMQLLLWVRWEELWAEEWHDLTCRVKVTWFDFQVSVGNRPKAAGTVTGDAEIPLWREHGLDMGDSEM